MARQDIDLGTGPNTRTGTNLRECMRRINLNFGELYQFIPLIGELEQVVSGLPAPGEIKSQIDLAIAGAIAALPSPTEIRDQINAAVAGAVAGVPTAQSIQAQIDAAVAATDISNFYTRAQADARFSGGTMPFRPFIGASKAYDAPDLYTELRRSNGGTAMSDTLPPASADQLADGACLRVHNIDNQGSILTLVPGAGTTISVGGISVPSILVEPGRTVVLAYDKPSAIWRPIENSLSALLSGNMLAEIAARGMAAQANARDNLGVVNVDEFAVARGARAARTLNSRLFP